jgi:hypothetical protein
MTSSQKTNKKSFENIDIKSKNLLFTRNNAYHFLHDFLHFTFAVCNALSEVYVRVCAIKKNM